MFIASHASIATKISEDEIASREPRKDATDGSNDEITNDLNHPVLKVCYM